MIMSLRNRSRTFWLEQSKRINLWNSKWEKEKAVA